MLHGFRHTLSQLELTGTKLANAILEVWRFGVPGEANLRFGLEQLQESKRRCAYPGGLGGRTTCSSLTAFLGAVVDIAKCFCTRVKLRPSCTS